MIAYLDMQNTQKKGFYSYIRALKQPQTGVLRHFTVVIWKFGNITILKSKRQITVAFISFLRNKI